MRSQPPWSDDFLQRSLIERAPPLTWTGITAWTMASVAGVGLVLTKPSGVLGAIALVLVGLGGFQAFRGLFRMAWLRAGGADQPLRSYLRRHLED